MAKVKSRPAAFPFPFFGSGEAFYFEWVQVTVALTKVVTPECLTWARKNLPDALESGLDKARPGEIWFRLWFGEEYGGDGVSDDVNRSIEEWLTKLHAKYPVLCAYRRPDSEAGGTRFDDWHAWSLANPPDAALLAKIPAGYGDNQMLDAALANLQRETQKQKRTPKRPK